MPEDPLPEVAAFHAFERGRIWAFANSTVLVLPDVALEVLLEQPVDDGALGVAGPVDASGLGERHASGTGGGKVGRECASLA